MARLCSRPGCSEQGAVAYGMVPEDLLFWMSMPEEAPTSDASLLCQQHADAMVVPRGWTLDDRRENVLRLFRPRPPAAPAAPTARAPRRARSAGTRPQQLQIDGTGEIVRPQASTPEASAAESPAADDRAAESPVTEPPAAAAPGAGSTRPATWEPEFDHDDDLGGLLGADSPLLARAFRGTGRPR